MMIMKAANGNEKGEKGQSSFELVVIIGVVVLLVLVVAGVLLGQLRKADADRDVRLLESLGEVIRAEVALAESVRGEYYHEFTLPQLVEGKDYLIESSGDGSVVLKMDSGAAHIVFLPSGVGGSFQKGLNVIRKEGEDINVN